MIAKINPASLKLIGDIKPCLLFGLTNNKRKERAQTQILPPKNTLPINIVSAETGTFGAISIIEEPITQKTVNGIRTIPRGIVTHLGSTLSGSI